MVRIFSLSVASAALALSSAAFAGQDAIAIEVTDPAPASADGLALQIDAAAEGRVAKEVADAKFAEAAADDAAESAEALTGAKPVKLVEFDGEFEVLKTSQRLRIWRSHLAYNITVGPDGEATACELTDGFRRTYVKKKLCTVLVKHHTFEPARDASDTPVEGVYSARLSYLEMRNNQ